MTEVGEVKHDQPCLRFGAGNFAAFMTIYYYPTRTISGVVPQIFDIIAKRLGRCYTFHEYPVGGSKLANGTWTGGVGLVTREEIDVSSLLILTAPRYHETDPSDYVFIIGHSAGYTRPFVQSDIAGFIKPYNAWVWALVLVSVLAILAALLLLSLTRDALIPTPPDAPPHHRHYHTRGVVGEVGNEQAVHPVSIARSSVVWVVCSILAQSVPLEPPRGVAKVLTGLWLLLSLILSLVYRCNLKAMLILPKITLPFDTLEELNNAGLPVWIAHHSVLHNAAYVRAWHVFPSGRRLRQPLGRLNKTFYNMDRVLNVTWGIQGFNIGAHVFAVPVPSIYKEMHTQFSKIGRCTTYKMKESFLSTYSGVFLFPKGSPLRKEFNKVVSGLREFGIISHMHDALLVNATECLKPVKAESGRALEMGDFYGVFSIYCGGVVLAMVCFLMEILMGERQGKEEGWR